MNSNQIESMFVGRNYVHGQFTKRSPESEVFHKINPSDEKTLGAFPQTHQKEIDLAYASARKTFRSWRKVSRIARAEYFYKISKIIEGRLEEIATVISLETGKSFNESIAEVNEALHMAQYAFGSGRTTTGEAVASELAEKDSYMLRKPKGVVAIVSPFNFPVAIGAFWCAAPAIVEGNTVIVKPSEDAPMSTQICAEIYHEAGLPPGVFNMVHGDGRVGDYLIRKDVDHICFTGSAEVGMYVRKVAAESWHKTTSCEMGSKSACIVFDDANLDLALEASFASAFKLSGQRCVSSSRLIVQRKIYNNFAQKFAEMAKNVKIGNPFNKNLGSCGTPAAICWENLEPNNDITYGPLINKDGEDKVLRYNQMVLDDDKTEVLLKGEKLPRDGYYMSPMVYKTEWRKVDFLNREVFGPHVAIIPFDTTEDAIRIYNDTEFGLAVGILTDDFRKARIMRDECDAGMIYWNGGSIAAESHLAFGGVKKSGNGYPSAARTFRAVTHEVSWTVNHADTLAFPQGMK